VVLAILLPLGTIFLIASWIMLLGGLMWQRSPWIAIAAAPILPIMTAGLVDLIGRWIRRTPALVITPAGVQINAFLATVRWIPSELIDDVVVERRRRGISFVRVVSHDTGAILKPLPWLRRVIAGLEGGAVRIPTTTINAQPEDVAVLIRELVIASR